jgi:hypothetical protein
LQQQQGTIGLTEAKSWILLQTQAFKIPHSKMLTISSNKGNAN